MACGILIALAPAVEGYGSTGKVCSFSDVFPADTATTAFFAKGCRTIDLSNSNIEVKEVKAIADSLESVKTDGVSESDPDGEAGAAAPLQTASADNRAAKRARTSASPPSPFEPDPDGEEAGKPQQTTSADIGVRVTKVMVGTYNSNDDLSFYFGL
eukprot:gene6388-17795_t